MAPHSVFGREGGLPQGGDSSNRYFPLIWPTPLNIQYLAAELEKEILPYKEQFKELKNFPNRTHNERNEVFWELNEIYPYPKGKDADSGWHNAPARIILRWEFHDLERPTQRPQPPGTENMFYLFFHMDTRNTKLRHIVQEIALQKVEDRQELRMRIVQGILELKKHYPHFAKVGAKNFDGGIFGYENGLEKRVNKNYKAEMKEYEKEGPANKLRKGGTERPGKILASWNEKSGILLELTFLDTDPRKLDEGIAVVLSYENVPLHREIGLYYAFIENLYSGARESPKSYRAKVRDMYIIMELEGGNQMDQIAESIFRILEKHALD